MKKVVILFILSILGINAYAQRYENFYFLYGQKQINIEFDYTWTEIKSVSDTVKKDMIEVFSPIWNDCFLKELNEELEDNDVEIGYFPNANFTIFIQILSIGNTGATKATAIIFNTETLEERCAIDIFGRGGMFGSFPNLIKDGIENCGEDLGDIIEDIYDLNL